MHFKFITPSVPLMLESAEGVPRLSGVHRRKRGISTKVVLLASGGGGTPIDGSTYMLGWPGLWFFQ